MKGTFLIPVLMLIAISASEPISQAYLPPRNAYLPPLKQFGPRPGKIPTGTLVIQVRSEDKPKIVLRRGPSANARPLIGPPSPNAPVRFVRPLKFVLKPQFLVKPNAESTQGPSRRPTHLTKIKFNYLPPSSSGYVYEKPLKEFSTAVKYSTIGNLGNEENNYNFEPIHTVPAPNLAQEVHFTVDNNKDQLEQYQVTEFSNDQIIRDQQSGQVKYFAPDPDPSLPVRQIPPSTDPFSMPSGANQLQSSKLTRPPATSYGVPIHPAPSANMVDGVPLSVFNPSFLVSQSQNLYNQHKQHLIKPAQVSPSSYGIEDLTQHVTSAGQIVHSAANDILPVTPTPQTDLLVQNIPLAPQIGNFAALISPSPQPIGPTASYQVSSITQFPPQINNFQDSAAQGGFVVSNFFGNQGVTNQLQHIVDNNHPFAAQQIGSTQQPLISEATNEPRNLFSHQYYQQQDQSAVSNPNPYFVDISQYQDQNQQTLDVANQQIQQQLTEQHAQHYASNQNAHGGDISAYQQHQQLLGQQLGSNTFGAFAPHGYQQASNLHKRSNELSEGSSQTESNTIESSAEQHDEPQKETSEEKS